MKLEDEFHVEMLAIYDKCRAIGYRPNEFRNMVLKHGGVQAAKRLINRPETSGLAELALRNKLELSMENLMSRERYHPLFTNEEIATAASRLK